MNQMREQEAVDVGDIEFSREYRYVCARDGQVGVTAVHTKEARDSRVVIHVTRLEFQPDETQRKLRAKVVNSAIASIELDAGSAKALHQLLGDTLAKMQPENGNP